VVKTLLALCAALLAGTAAAQQPLTGVTAIAFQTTNAITNLTVMAPAGIFTNTVVYDSKASTADAFIMLWDAPDTRTNYNYRIEWGNILSTQRLSVDSGTNQMCAFFGLSTNITYYFYVVATSPEQLEGPPSNLVVVRRTK
jgi:hypothetical protein